MIIENQRAIHEDLERLEQAIADRALDEPKNIRDRLARDHEISRFLSRIQDQSKRLLDIYKDPVGERVAEIQHLSTTDDVFDKFYAELNNIKDFHRRYPNEPVENLERAYKRRALGGDLGEQNGVVSDIDAMFTGEEAHGRFFDLTRLHEQYLNLQGVQSVRRLTYVQYLDVFDVFVPPQCPVKRPEKMTDKYFTYVGDLAEYLEGFMRRTRPLEDIDRLFQTWDEEFDALWKEDKAPGWSQDEAAAASISGPTTQGSGQGIWCADCAKEFKNDGVYKAHLTGRKHLRAVEQRKTSSSTTTQQPSQQQSTLLRRLKERTVAEREHRVRSLALAMQSQRADTRTNVERKQGMTDRERQQELAALFAEDPLPPSSSHLSSNPNNPFSTDGGMHPSRRTALEGDDDGSDSDSSDKIYNPLKLPLAWDGKPIPFWLYKLHGLGVEFPCEICGNFVYMGRRAFDKHFNESRHLHGLKCLGITNTALFREIVGIDDALKLWEKVQGDRKKKEKEGGGEGVVQMEDAEGNVMPEKVYYDLQKQGLL